jgi:hypothetical protein
MTLGHFIYIPGILLVGVMIGYWLGGRAAETAHRDREESAARRAGRGAERRAEKQGRGDTP